MTFHRAAMFGICVSVAVAAVAPSVHAQAPVTRCTDATILVAAPVAAPVMPPMPVDDVQWCVDSDDPRCSADPAGAPSAHLAHAGDAARFVRDVPVNPAPVATLARTDRDIGFFADGHGGDLDRPPQHR